MGSFLSDMSVFVDSVFHFVTEIWNIYTGTFLGVVLAIFVIRRVFRIFHLIGG